MMTAKWLVLCALLLVGANAAQDLLLSGSFITSVVQDDGSIRHASGILAYDPDSDEFVDKFSGGVYVNVGTITLMQETVFGIVGAGHFRYVDDGFGYSSAVLYYDGEEDDFQGMNDGIWLDQGDSVRYIASVNNDVVFAGTFSTVESISAEDFDNDDADTVVPNIVKMNSDKEYSLLNDPDNIFPNNRSDSIQGLVGSADGETIYILSINRGIYSWDNDNYYQLLVEATNITHNTLAVDEDNNLYGIVKTSSGNSGGSGTTYTYYLAVFNASTGYSGNYINFLSLNTGQCSLSVTGSSTTVLLTPWNNGILISYPDYTTCTSTIFQYFNTTTGALDPDFTFPAGPFDISSITGGKNDDLWVIPYANVDAAETDPDYIYYYQTGSSDWVHVSLSPVRKFTAYSLVWDSDKDNLVVFLNDLTSGFEQKLVKVNTNTYPPTGSTQLNPGTLGNVGAVHGVASIQDADDEDYEIFIGGVFDRVGNGEPALNLVKFSKGDWEPMNSPPVKTLYAYGSTLYIGYLDPANNGDALPVAVINTQGDSNNDAFTDLPVVNGGFGTVTAIYSDDEEVFIGGDFSCILPGSSNTAHGVVVYSKANQRWYDIGIPATINSGGDGYLINSFSVNVINGSSILAIGGYFTFTAGGYDYNSVALYNLDQDRWVSVPVSFSSQTQVSEVLLNNTNTMYLAGEFDVQFQANVFGVASYNINTGVLTEVGDLEDFVDGIAFYTDDKNREWIYAGGLLNSLPNANNGSYPLAYTQSPSSGSNQTWIIAGQDTILFNCFWGSISHIIYQTGGQGVNGTNGNDSSYSSGGVNGGGGGGGNGWWITLIVLAVLFVVIAVPVAGFAAWKYFGKRKNYYEEL